MDRHEWLKWRKSGIGSSDAPIIMGVSKFKTIHQLYEDKLSDEIKEETNYITDLGNEIEPKIRDFMQSTEGMTFTPALVELADHSFIRASLDGQSEDKEIIIEIKMVGASDFELIKNGSCPPQYVPQVQHQLMVSGAQVCIVVGFLFKKGDNKEVTNDRVAVAEVYPDNEYQTKLFLAEKKFWDHVFRRVPLEKTSDDFKDLKGVTKWANQWKKAEAKIKELELLSKEARAHLLEAADASNHEKLIANGIRIVKVSREGSIDYSAIPELKSVDLDQYRKPGSSSWKMDIPKQKEDKDGKKS